MRSAVRILVVLMLALCGQALAQNYPAHPIRMVLPFAPGGTADIIARPVAQRMGELLGQSVVVDNRGGAGGVVGAALAAKSPADGYTLLLGSSGALTISQSLGKLPYDPVADFTPVGLVATSQFILVVHPSVPAKNVRELIALAKSRPGRLIFGSAGTGNVGHLAAELFDSMAGVSMIHVPYKGAGPMTVDLLAGQVDLSFPGLSSLVPYVKAGRVRALAVTGATRSAVLPDLQTLSEAGLAGYEATTFWGLLAPARTAGDIVRRLAAVLREALKNPELIQYYVNQGNDPTASTPEEFAQRIRVDIDKWSRVIKNAGIKPE